MGLLSGIVELASVGRSPIAIDPARCLHGLNQLSNCEACRQVCPAGAISEENPPEIDLEACWICRACLPVCPVDAIRAHDNVTPLMKCGVRARGHAIDVLCDRHPEPEKAPHGSEVGIFIRGCLAALGVGAMVELGTMDLKGIVLRLEHCKDCELGALQPEIEGRLEAAKSILQAWNQADHISSLDKGDVGVDSGRAVWDAENPPVSRRELFQLSTLLGGPSGVGDEGLDAPPRQHLAPDRQRIVDALGNLYRTQQTQEGVAITAPGFFQLTISEACTACGNCSRACPTEALLYQERDEKEFRFLFMPQMCIGCELCMRICPVEAIGIEHDPDLANVYSGDPGWVLRQGYIGRCLKCGAPIASETPHGLCTLCESRRNNPFGSRKPPYPVKKP